MASVDLEAKMTIKKLYENGCSKAHIADLLGGQRRHGALPRETHRGVGA